MWSKCCFYHRTVASFTFSTHIASLLPRKQTRSLSLVTLSFLSISAAIVSTNEHLSNCEEQKPNVQLRKELFPDIAPYKEGFLAVDETHTLYYGLYGNPHGKPVLFIHGGPGGGTHSSVAKYFDPKVYQIVLVDQRGCGKSTPLGSLVNNTTNHLIEDFETLRKSLNISRWQLFGGSWGSTLALAYAIKHPEVVSEMILRGIFLCRQRELAWLYEGQGANFIFPEDWERFSSLIPSTEIVVGSDQRGQLTGKGFIEAYGRRIHDVSLSEEEKIKAVRSWTQWEGRVCQLVQEPLEQIGSAFPLSATIAFAAIENHYFLHRGFFPSDDYLLHPKNLASLANIPVTIIQGRYDIVCPPISAYELHRALPHSEYKVVLAGHHPLNEQTIAELVQATEKYKHRH